MIQWEQPENPKKNHKKNEHETQRKYGPDYDKSTDSIRAKKRVLHLLERSPKSEKQIRDKLCDGGYQQSVIDEAVDYAKSFGYIDDERFARDFVRIYCDKKSRLRLSSDLSKKGISKELIETAIQEEYAVDEVSLIRNLLKKRGYYDINETDYLLLRKAKEKHYRFLASRGYSSSSIRKAMELEDEF